MAGVDVLKALWQTFLIPDSQLIDKLQSQVHPEITKIITMWPTTQQGGGAFLVEKT